MVYASGVGGHRSLDSAHALKLVDVGLKLNAALACGLDFPKCKGAWWPSTDFAEGFVLWRGIGVDYEGGVLDASARAAIQIAHRIGAAIVSAYFLFLGFRLAFAPPPGRSVSCRGLTRLDGESGWRSESGMPLRPILGKHEKGVMPMESASHACRCRRNAGFPGFSGTWLQLVGRAQRRQTCDSASPSGRKRTACSPIRRISTRLPASRSRAGAV